MVFILKNIKNGNEVCLSYEKKHTIGRRSFNDIIVKDPTVSKKHALLITKAEKVILKDLNSKRGTLVNGKEIKSSHILKSSNKIKFGLKDAEIQFLELNWRTVVSDMIEADEKILRKALNNCHVKIADTWSNKCTHYTTHRITLKEEILSALIDRKPFVTTQFWLKLEKCLHDNDSLPDTWQFFPPLDESLRKYGLDFNPDLRRRFLFEEKQFVVFDEENEYVFAGLIEKCGGTVLFWTKLSKETKLKILNNSNYVFVNNGNVAKYIDTSTCKNLFSKRDICLAICQCSTQIRSEMQYIGDSTTDNTKCGTNISEADSTTPDFLDELPTTDGGRAASHSSIAPSETFELLAGSSPKKLKAIEHHSDRTERKNDTKLVLNPFAKVHSSTKASAPHAISKKPKNDPHSMPKWLEKRRATLPTDNGLHDSLPVVDLTMDDSSQSEERQMDSFIKQVKSRFKDVEIELVLTQNRDLR